MLFNYNCFKNYGLYAFYYKYLKLKVKLLNEVKNITKRSGRNPLISRIVKLIINNYIQKTIRNKVIKKKNNNNVNMALFLFHVFKQISIFKLKYVKKM